MPLVPTLWRQRQAVFHEFKTSLDYRASFRASGTYTEKPYLKKKKSNNKT